MHRPLNTRIQKCCEQWIDGERTQTCRGSRSRQRSPGRASRPQWVCAWEGACLLPLVAVWALPRYSYDPPLNRERTVVAWTSLRATLAMREKYCPARICQILRLHSCRGEFLLNATAT